MPKRPDNKETVLLALELMRRIPRTRTITAKELHAQLADAHYQRDLRTIQRQLEMLTEHFEIERDDRSKPYGYRWKEKAEGMALPMLTEQESLLLTLAEQHLKALLPVGVMNAMDGFFTQARANLAPYSNAQRAREWLKKVRVVGITQPLLPPKIQSGVFEQVSNALYANLWLQVDYTNAAGKRTQANVMPLGLAQQGPRLFLACRFEGYDNERSLALHRIHAAQATSLTFERPADFDLAQYDDDGRFAFGDGQQIQLTFRVEKEAGLHLLETPLSTDQHVTELADAYEIRATVVDSARLDWWLNGFGPALTVVSKVNVMK